MKIKDELEEEKAKNEHLQKELDVVDLYVSYAEQGKDMRSIINENIDLTK